MSEQLGSAPYVIVVGCEKGGTGKSTTSMHLIAYLMQMGAKVGSLDLDARQATLSRYIENRKQTREERGSALKLPYHLAILPSQLNDRSEAESADRDSMAAAFLQFEEQGLNFVIVDCAGTDSYLVRLAHGRADTLISPVNDSLVDLDVFAHIDPRDDKKISPSVYAEMVFERRKERLRDGGKKIDWVVMRNRLSNFEGNHKHLMSSVLTKLSKRLMFRLAPGLSERLIYRELFPLGLTMLDIFDMSGQSDMPRPSLSHVAARQEIRSLVDSLSLPFPLSDRV